MRGIANILRAHIELELRIVVSKLNCDDVTNIAKLIIRYFPTTTVVNFVGLEMRGNCVANADQVLISYQDAFQKSKEAIRLLIHHGIDVGLYNFPYCMIDEEYWPIAQKSISAYKSMFYDACEQCRLRHECCGIFLATMNFYKPKVYPITSGDQYDKLL
jgi:radical SAM domain protein